MKKKSIALWALLALTASGCGNILGITDIPNAEEGGIADSSVASDAAKDADGSPVGTPDADASPAPPGPDADACALATVCISPSNSCQSGTTACDGTCGSLVNVANGTLCATGACENGTCSCDPGQACVPSSAPCHNGKLTCGDGGPVCIDQGTDVTPGTVCGVAGANTFCSPTGSCSCTANQACTFTANPCHLGVTSCTTSGSLGVSVCADSGNDVANGTICGSGQACDQGACTSITCSTTTADGGVATCAPANACDQGAVTCGADAGIFGPPSCTDTETPVGAGAICDGGVCNGSGTCTPCVTGAGCVPTANPCDQGSQVCTPTISCTQLTSHQPPGTLCGGTTHCDGNGNCNCVSGGTCTPTNPCHNGAFECSTGVQVCKDQGTDMTGNPSCGGGNFCNAGTCVAPTCTATTADGGAIACTPTSNVCHNGALACSGPFGTSSCTDLTTNVANCTTCAAGSECSGGTCTLFSSGASCPFSNACEKGEQTCTVGAGIACTDSGSHEPAGTVCSSGADNACDGNGNCSCAGGGGCTLPGSCKAATFSCASGTAVCTAGSTNLGDGAPCGTNEVCFSGTCGPCTTGAACIPAASPCVAGAIACTSGQPVCVATATDSPPGTACGDEGGTTYCDGNGNCNCTAGAACTGVNVDPCANGVESCATGTALCVSGGENAGMNGQSCGGTGTCTSGACACPSGQEYIGGACTPCPALTTSKTLYVNASIGTDGVCCGAKATAGFGAPCQTITYGLSHVGGTGWTVNFTGDSAGNASTSETYPIELSGSVTLQGQGTNSGTAISCLPGVSGKAVVEVDTDSTTVQVDGVTLGTQCNGTATGASYGIYVHGGGVTGITNVAIAQVDQGIYVGPNSLIDGGGDVWVSGGRIGLNIDGGNGSPNTMFISNTSEDAVHCASITNPSSASVGSFVAYVAAAARYAIYAGPGCNLTGDADLGAGSTAGNGAVSCPTPRTDNVGLYVEGNGVVTMGLSISCMNGDGIVLANNTSMTGSPSVYVGGVIHNNGCAGVRAEAGTFTMSGVNIRANHWGVIQQTSATGSTGIVNIDGTSGANEIYCNGKTEPGACCVTGNCPNGANVWNDSALPLTATNNYWADSPLGQCTCSSTALTSCTCTGSAFPNTTPPDDVDALASPFVDGGAAGAITTTGPLVLTSAACNY